MFEQQSEKYSSDSGSIPAGRKAKRGKRAKTSVISRFQTVNVLHLLSGLTQFFLGLAVVALSLMGLVQPLYLALLLCVIGSLSCIVGLFLLYTLFSDGNTFDTLVNDAIKRAITHQN